MSPLNTFRIWQARRKIKKERALHRDDPVVATSLAFINEIKTYEPPVAVEMADLTNPQEIQVVSDLHLEFKFRVGGDNVQGYGVFDFPVAAPNLALLGDIGLASHAGLYAFLEKQLQRFKRVFFVPGNHEYYGSSPSSAMTSLQKFSDKVAKYHAGDPALWVTILGCTLWSHIPPHAADAVALMLNDFHQISSWSVGAHNASHDFDKLWLTRELAKLEGEGGRRVVVLTHHAPTTPGTSEPRFEQGDNLPSYAFVTPLSDQPWWGPPITTWAFGHTHFNCDFMRAGVRVIANQRGYEAFESHRIGFVEDKVLVV